MTDRPDPMDGEQSDEIVAGEYVLGVLSHEDRRRVERRMATDPDFARRVRRWQDNLENLDVHYGEASVPAHLLGGIEARLFGPEAATPSRLGSLWSSLAFWRGAAIGTTALACGLAIALFAMPQAGMRPLPLVANLASTQGPVALVASYDAATGLMRLTPGAGTVDQPKSLELWLVPEGKDPISLGVFGEDGRGEIFVAPELRNELAAGVTLAVSVEPPGGSKTGKATGPVIAAGLAAAP